MQLKFWRGELKLAHQWRISRGSESISRVVFVELKDRDGLVGLGESAPSRRYQQSLQTVEAFLRQIDPERLDFNDLEASRAHMSECLPGDLSAKGAVEMALLDGAGKRARKTVCELLGLRFREGIHETSFSIGIDSPEVVREKVRLARNYPLLKLKVGVPGDRENLKALREAAPKTRLRVDANEGWATKEQALEMLELFAEDGNIEFCEQPLPAATPKKDLAWLKERSPLPLIADESCVTAEDVAECAEFFDGVNIKLVKAGGIEPAMKALQTARKAGLRTMLGCMIESSILISAAAQLAELTDYLDLDGNILIVNDPFEGPTSDNGMISFARAEERYGLRVRARSVA
jgi:L-Ala-D/L-Glu epimerase